MDQAWMILHRVLRVEKDGARIRIRPWVPHGAVALDTMVIWFDLSWGLLSLDFNLNLQKSEFRLEFSSLPPDRELGPDDECMADIHSKRCITVSGNLVRYVEIIDPNGKAPTVSMWHRQRGAQGWEWTLNYKVSWEDIRNDDSYDEAGLPRQAVPMLVCVNPLDPNVVYFSVRKNVIFGVNVPEHRVVHSEPIGRAMAFPNSRYFVTWNLHPGTEPVIGHVSLDLPADGYANEKHEEKDEEPPHDRKGKSKAMDGQRSTPASSGRNKTLRIK